VSFYSIHDSGNHIENTQLYDIAFLALWESLYQQTVFYLTQIELETSESSEYIESSLWYVFSSSNDNEEDTDDPEPKPTEPRSLPQWLLDFQPPTPNTVQEVPRAGSAPLTQLLEIFFQVTALPEVKIPHDYGKLGDRNPDWIHCLKHPFMFHLPDIDNAVIWLWVLHILYDSIEAPYTVRQLAQAGRDKIVDHVVFFASQYWLQRY